MLDNSYDFVILGGGLAGLSVGFNLLVNQPEKKVLILEGEDRIGGLAKSFHINGLTFDFGPHVLRTSDRRLEDWISSLVQLNDYRTNPATVKYGKYFDHVIPVITWENIARLPVELSARVRKELSQLKRSTSEILSANFEDALVPVIGATLFWEFFGEYSRKWWGVDTHDLSSDLAPRNISVREHSEYAHLTTNFNAPKREFYPANGGYGAIACALLKKLCATYSGRLKIELNSRVTGIHCHDGRARNVVVNDDVTYQVGSAIYSSIPLTHLSRMLGLESRLKYRSNICVFAEVDRKKSRDVGYSWLYFPEKSVAFSRFYSMGQFSSSNETLTSRGYVAEITCFEGDSTWMSPDDYLAARVESDMETAGLISKGAVINTKIVREAHAYPLPVVGYKEERKKTLDNIHAIATNIVTVGRTGSFNYWNSDAVLSLYQGGL